MVSPTPALLPSLTRLHLTKPAHLTSTSGTIKTVSSRQRHHYHRSTEKSHRASEQLWASPGRPRRHQQPRPPLSFWRCWFSSGSPSTAFSTTTILTAVKLFSTMEAGCTPRTNMEHVNRSPTGSLMDASCGSTHARMSTDASNIATWSSRGTRQLARSSGQWRDWYVRP